MSQKIMSQYVGKRHVENGLAPINSLVWFMPCHPGIFPCTVHTYYMHKYTPIGKRWKYDYNKLNYRQL